MDREGEDSTGLQVDAYLYKIDLVGVGGGCFFMRFFGTVPRGWTKDAWGGPRPDLH